MAKANVIRPSKALSHKKRVRPSENANFEKVDGAMGSIVEARAIMECAGKLLDEDEHAADEATCLRFGLTLLSNAYADLDSAIAALRRPATSKVAAVKEKAVSNRNTPRISRRRLAKAS